MRLHENVSSVVIDALVAKSVHAMETVPNTTCGEVISAALTLTEAMIVQALKASETPAQYEALRTAVEDAILNRLWTRVKSKETVQ